MAIYGVGAMYGGRHDKTQDFIDNKCACIGWEPLEAPALHSMMSKMKIGDFVYIKSISIAHQEVRVKAIGVVVEDKIKDYSNLGRGVGVKWVWQGEKCIDITESMYKNNVLNNTLYEEFNPHVQVKILNLAFRPSSAT